MPVDVNIDIYAGDTFKVVIPYTGTEDISGATALCHFRSNIQSLIPDLEVIPVVNEIDSTIELTIDGTDTSGLIPAGCSTKQYKYDVQVTFLNGVVNTPQKGIAIATLDVTRP